MNNKEKRIEKYIKESLECLTVIGERNSSSYKNMINFFLRSISKQLSPFALDPFTFSPAVMKSTMYLDLYNSDRENFIKQIVDEDRVLSYMVIDNEITPEEYNEIMQDRNY